MNYNKLNDEEKHVIEDKGTERPFSGEYDNFYEEGEYICKKCDTTLFKSSSKFSSSCGWPSFDNSLDTVKRIPDTDGRRVEIVCSNCNGHLGHVFEGENFTDLNTRHCVNSISIKFKADKSLVKTDESYAYFAAGCFWGVEYYFQKQEGVISVESGYMGGELKNPTYADICTGVSGHLELVRVKYNKNKVSYKDLSKLFFEIHDFSQTNGQGPDLGPQYLSCVFYEKDEEKEIVLELISLLEKKGFKVATSLVNYTKFYIAEENHQNYYARHQTVPYCHSYKKIF